MRQAMRDGHNALPTLPRVGRLLALMLVAIIGSGPARAASLDELVSSVVRIKTVADPDGQTAQSLGREREGSGIVIDEDGLVLTIGYLMVEALSAELTTNAGRTVAATIVGYDHETGFGVLRAMQPLNLEPLAFGRSADLQIGDPALIASFGGVASAAHVVAKREFAGSWEYLLDEAIFTAPPHPAWSGAALINREGKLVGVGSLIVANTGAKGEGKAEGESVPGNMFVPIDQLGPILADLIAEGRASGPAR